MPGWLASFLLLALAAPGFAQISGRILAGGSGAPLAGARVLAVSSGGNGAPVFLEAVSGSGGVFAIAGVAPGNYSICVEYTPRPGRGSRRNFWQIEQPAAYLNPCDWAEPIHVSAPGSVEIRLEPGVNAYALADDPNVLMSVVDGAGRTRAVWAKPVKLGGVWRYGGVVPKQGNFTVHAEPASAPAQTGSGIQPAASARP